MRTLTLEENHVFENEREIPDLSAFLKSLPSQTEIALILKTHDAFYHLCPVRKAVPYLKSAEFPPDYWIGERLLPKGRTLVGGIAPSPFMRKTVALLAEHSFALKGVFLWTDLVIQAYGLLPLGWTLIWHDQRLMVCHDGVLRISRSSYLPLAQELPAILRYLKRFGYQEEMPLTLLQTTPFTDAFPPFVQQEIRVPHEFSLEGFSFQVPELTPFQRLYAWPRRIRKIACALTLFNLLGTTYLGWRIKALSDTGRTLTTQLGNLPTVRPIDDAKMEAFKAYCHLRKDKPDLLTLLRQLTPFIKEEAVATRLHWTTDPVTLVLHLELTPSANPERFLLTLRSQLQGYQITWQEKEDDPLQGILTMTLNQQESS